VVAADQDDLDAGVAEPGHLPAEEEARVVVGPVAVVEVADDQDEPDLLLDRQGDEVLKRPAGRPPALLDRGPLIAVEPPVRAVEVDVRGVEELDHRGTARPEERKQKRIKRPLDAQHDTMIIPDVTSSPVRLAPFGIVPDLDYGIPKTSGSC